MMRLGCWLAWHPACQICWIRWITTTIPLWVRSTRISSQGIIPYQVSYRAVHALIGLGAKFSQASIFTICSRVDYNMFNVYLRHMELDPKVENESSRTIMNLRNIDSNTPLHMLMVNFNKNNSNAQKIGNLLVELGADCNVFNRDNWAPLHLAIRKN